MKFFDAGQNACGVIAIGQFATGVFALGQVATGVVAIGQVARGGIAIGQGAIGIVAVGMGACGFGASLGMLAVGGRTTGMLALGVVARGLVPISIWPRQVLAPGTRPPPTPVPLDSVMSRRIEHGWVRAHLVPGGGGAVLAVNNQRLPVDVRLPQTASRFERDVLAFLVWEQQVAPGMEVGADYRAAPQTVPVLACNEIAELPPSPPSRVARGIVAAVLMAIVAVAVWSIALGPLLDGLETGKPVGIETGSSSSE